MPLIRQAFVLGAGMGLRLRPLTEQKPKPLVPIFGKPLITFSLDHLLSVGIESFAINTHRLASQFEEAFAKGSYGGAPVKLLHEQDLLETGGGIKNAEHSLGNEPFIVYSGDILTDMPLQPLLEEHFARKNDVTLALREDGLSTDVAVRNGRVIDIAKKFGHDGSCDFGGVSIWNPSIFARIPTGKKISFIPIVLEWMAQNGRVGGVVLNEGKWFNIGSRDGYLEVHRTIAEDYWQPRYVREAGWPKQIADDAEVDPSAKLSGFNSIGSRCRIGAKAVIENSILWPEAEVAPGSELRDCIVRTGQKAEGVLRDRDL